MSKILQLWLYFCVILFQSIVLAKSLPNQCREQRDEKNSIHWYFCGQNVDDDQIKIKISLGEYLEITCSSYDQTDYLNLSKVINVTAAIKRLIITQCPVPESSFNEFLNFLHIYDIENVSFQSSEKFPTIFAANNYEKLASVKKLNLQANNIITLHEQIFDDMINLEELNLSNNQLRSLPEKLFERVGNLRRLDLQHNNFTSLDINMNFFQYAPNLMYVNLCDNSLDNISTSVFDSSANLTTLELCSNNIAYLNDGIFDKLQHLEEINLSSNKLTSLSGNLFHNCVSLKILRLNGNLLEKLPNGIFRQSKNLQQLDISNNRLNDLDDNVFDSVTNLEMLQLYANNLTSIKRNFFNGLTSLMVLNLSGNGLSSVDRKSFLDLEHLETLDLSNNRLTLEESKLGVFSPFVTNLNLRYLNLRNNLLTKVFADWRFVFNNLKELDLSGNQIKNLTTEEFMFNTSNATIHFANNPIEIIDLDHLEEKAKPPCSRSEFFIRNFSKRQTHNNNFNLRNISIKCNCRALILAKYFQMQLDKNVYQKVNLSSTGVNCDSPDTMKNIPLKSVNLTTLKCSLNESYPQEASKCPYKCDCHYRSWDKANIVNCSQQGLDKIPEQIPIIENAKIELLFSRNKLKSIEGLSELAMKGNVTVISLSYNELESIDGLMLPKTLEALKLDNNKISRLSPSILEFLRSTITLNNLSLHGNPWECTCETQHIQAFLQRKRTTLWLDDLQGIRCRNVKFSVLEHWESELCPTTKAMLQKYFTVFALLFVPSLVLYVKYKRRIKIWMFTHKICLWLVTEKEIDKDKLYDAFVSFSHKDQYFVDQYLIPELEEKGDHTFKLCIHYRDFVVGEFIPSQIVYSVENSRRTIIIMTSNFLQSVWTRMEFRTAHLQAIKERHARVIVILLEEINCEELDPELKAYITLNTYVKWGDSSFWEKLRYALPHPQITCRKNRRPRTAVLSETELREIQNA